MYIAPRAVGRGAKNCSLFFQRERIYCNITLYPRYLFVSGLFVFFEANNPTTQTILLLSAYVWRTCRMVSDEELRVSIEVSLKRTSASTALWSARRFNKTCMKMLHSWWHVASTFILCCWISFYRRAVFPLQKTLQLNVCIFHIHLQLGYHVFLYKTSFTIITCNLACDKTFSYVEKTVQQTSFSKISFSRVLFLWRDISG